MMTDDMTLVREYVRSNSEQAFATLVSRHINLVHSVALRHVSDPHLAEEITQTVFIVLARKVKSLSPKTILSGWLCRTARYVSADTLKSQRRRQSCEQESQMQSILNESDSDAWKQIAPLLDEALNCLGGKDHNAVVLRFFDGKDLKQVGVSLGMGEDAARMRVNRGVEKLRKWFTKRGVTLSATAIAGALSANSVQAAPTGLAAAVSAAALSGTTINTTAVIAATKAIAMTTLQKALIISLVAALVLSAASFANRRAPVKRGIAVSFTGFTNLPNNAVRFALFSIHNEDRLPIRWRGNWVEVEGLQNNQAATINPSLPWFTALTLKGGDSLTVAVGEPLEEGRWRFTVVCSRYTLQERFLDFAWKHKLPIGVGRLSLIDSQRILSPTNKITISSPWLAK